LQVGPAGAFDALAVMGPSVLKVGGKHLMWYDARATGQPRSIASVGLATSHMAARGPSTPATR
jgi:hypothetical protein